MISTFQLFKIIFGIIVSGFIIYFLISYSGAYSGLQEDTQRSIILKNFEKGVNDVYLSGNAMDFSDFSKLEFTMFFDAEKPAGIKADVGKIPNYVPLFFSIGEKLFIDRNYLDLGWWKFYYVIAMPETKIIFNPLSIEGTTEWINTWNLLRNVTELMPSSSGFETKVTFGFCDGTDIQESLCSAGICERDDFRGIIRNPSGTVFSKCTENFPDNYRLVIISGSCSQTFAPNSICIRPESESYGKIFMKDNEYEYRDYLDVAVIILGGESESIYGIAGENLYTYKKNVFAERTLIAAKIMSKRTELISKELPNTQKWQDCKNFYNEFQNIMNSISSAISTSDMSQFYIKQAEAKEFHSKLVNSGCDYEP